MTAWLSTVLVHRLNMPATPVAHTNDPQSKSQKWQFFVQISDEGWQKLMCQDNMSINDTTKTFKTTRTS